MRFGLVLKELLEERGMSQAELGRMIGKQRGHISSLINGQIKEPTLTVAIDIADALDIDIYDIVERMEEDEDASLEDSGEC